MDVVVRTVAQQVDGFSEPGVPNIEFAFVGVVNQNVLANVGTEIVVDGVADYEAVLELGHADLNATGLVVMNFIIPDYNLPGPLDVNPKAFVIENLISLQ
jgi:hypothetical protein